MPWTLAFLLVPLALADGSPTDPVVGPLEPLLKKPSSELVTVVERWSADREGVGRRFPVEFSPTRIGRLREFSEAWRGRLKELDFDALGTEGKVDYLLLDNELKSDLDRLDREKRRAEETAGFLPFSRTITDLVEARRRLDPVDPIKSAEVLARLPGQLDAARKEVSAREKDKKTPQPVALRASRDADALRTALGGWFRYYDGYDPTFSWWVRAPYRKADEALGDYAKFLADTVAEARRGDDDTIRGDPIGRDGLLEDLRAEMIAYSPEELLAIGEKEFAWCEAEMKKASKEMGFGDDWKAALEKVKTLYVPAGDQPRLVRELAKEAIDFVEKHDLVTVPALAKEDWRVEMMSPRRRRSTRSSSEASRSSSRTPPRACRSKTSS